MIYYCDLHIHSALSPCGDDEMTPNNIVNMAHILGLDIIALCDHNSIKNVEATIKAAEKLPLLVVPGMELETSEEVHFVCLFENMTVAREFDDWLAPFKPTIKNNPEIFGEQIILDENDEQIGTEENLLVSACSVSVYDVVKKINSLDAVIIPAHIDRSSYSIISNLGFIPDDLGFSTIEISKKTTVDEAQKNFPHIKKYRIIQDSDAHYLEKMMEKENAIELAEKSARELIRVLKYTNQ